MTKDQSYFESTCEAVRIRNNVSFIKLNPKYTRKMVFNIIKPKYKIGPNNEAESIQEFS